MPPLGPGEMPWSDHEVQLRLLNAAEETPPAGLEQRIWNALTQKHAALGLNRAPWIAAAVAGCSPWCILDGLGRRPLARA